MFRYDCKGNDIHRCDSKGESCKLHKHCEQGCFKLVGGATCVDKLPHSDKRETNAVKVVDLKARKDKPQENKYYICSSNGASVLVCRYGFCSTDHYCTDGAWCHGDCTCCKKSSPVARGMPDGFATQVKDEGPKSLADNIESKVR